MRQLADSCLKLNYRTATKCRPLMGHKRLVIELNSISRTVKRKSHAPVYLRPFSSLLPLCWLTRNRMTWSAIVLCKLKKKKKKKWETDAEERWSQLNSCYPSQSGGDKITLYWIKCDPVFFSSFPFLLFHQSERIEEETCREKIGDGAAIHDGVVRARDFNLIVGNVSKRENFTWRNRCQ